MCACALCASLSAASCIPTNTHACATGPLYKCIHHAYSAEKHYLIPDTRLLLLLLLRRNATVSCRLSAGAHTKLGSCTQAKCRQHSSCLLVFMLVSRMIQHRRSLHACLHRCDMLQRSASRTQHAIRCFLCVHTADTWPPPHVRCFAAQHEDRRDWHTYTCAVRRPSNGSLLAHDQFKRKWDPCL